MRALDITTALAGFERRGAGTDAERRAARRLARDLTAEGYRVTTEPFWCRPNWALAHAWHVALALAGSLLSVRLPVVGAALLGAALVSVLADDLTGLSPGRRLTPERASQNVLARPADGAPERAPLVIAAGYDVGRAAFVCRDALRLPAAWLRRKSGPLAVGWLAWLSIAITWSLAVAIVRATGHHSTQILGAVQLPPTVTLVLALALLLEAAAAGYSGRLKADAVAAAVALAHALKTTPPRNVAVELVLAGAGAGNQIGMRRFLRAHRRELRDRGAIVLGIAPSGDAQPCWLRSDGRLIPVAYTRRLRELSAAVAGDLAAPGRHRASTLSLLARAHNLPAIALGTGAAEEALERAVAFAVQLAHAIDAVLEPHPDENEPAPTPV